MTEVQDGHVVVVGSLVQTQVVLQRVFHLREMEKIRKKLATIQITSNRDAEVFGCVHSRRMLLPRKGVSQKFPSFQKETTVNTP